MSLGLYEELNDRWGAAASLNALAIGACDSGDYDTAQGTFERCLQFWRALDNPLETARCVHNLANVAKLREDFFRAQVALREATAIFEQVGDRSGAAWSINQQGDIAREQGDLSAAGDHYRQALKAFREAEDRWGCARSLADLGYVYCEQKKHEDARNAYREALETFTELGHKRGMARALEGSACLAAARGQSARALKLAAAAQHLRRLMGARLPQAEQSKLDQKLVPAWQSLGEAEGKRAWGEGTAMDIDTAIEYSLREPS
ncbi:MAG: tetratricopeptide repeat protein [Acidobacteriaceae bacterium]|nr:tetratricopeptide repeat protein [Acidobacteriaceae bacterium]